MASFACIATRVVTTALFLIPANVAVGVRVVEGGKWPIPLPTSSIASFHGFPFANECFRFRSSSVIAWPTIRNLSDILNIFVRSVFGRLRRRAQESLGLKQPQCGAVTFVQRFNSALGLNVHFHMVALDGVYSSTADGRPEFHELPPPEDEEVLQVTTLIA